MYIQTFRYNGFENPETVVLIKKNLLKTKIVEYILWVMGSIQKLGKTYRSR